MNDSRSAPDDLATWTDQQLMDEWSRSDEEVGNPKADALASELQRRDLDF